MRETLRMRATAAIAKIATCMKAAAPNTWSSNAAHWLPRIPPRFFASLLEAVNSDGSLLEKENKVIAVKTAKNTKQSARKSRSKGDESELDFFLGFVVAIYM